MSHGPAHCLLPPCFRHTHTHTHTNTPRCTYVRGHVHTLHTHTHTYAHIPQSLLSPLFPTLCLHPWLIADKGKKLTGPQQYPVLPPSISGGRRDAASTSGSHMAKPKPHQTWGLEEPGSQFRGVSSACDSPLLPAYPLGVGNNL